MEKKKKEHLNLQELKSILKGILSLAIGFLILIVVLGALNAIFNFLFLLFK